MAPEAGYLRVLGRLGRPTNCLVEDRGKMWDEMCLTGTRQKRRKLYKRVPAEFFSLLLSLITPIESYQPHIYDFHLHPPNKTNSWLLCKHKTQNGDSKDIVKESQGHFLKFMHWVGPGRKVESASFPLQECSNWVWIFHWINLGSSVIFFPMRWNKHKEEAMYISSFVL